MSNPTSFDEATSKIATLMASVGGNVDAYENEGPAVVEVGNSTFEAALASITSHVQHNEISTGQPHPILDDTSNGPLIDEFPATEDCPFEAPPQHEGETPTSEEELAFFEEIGVAHPDVAPPDPESVPDEVDGLIWGDVTGLVLLAECPDPIEDCYAYQGTVYANDELKDIYHAFRFAQRTGEPQTVILESGQYEMTLQHGSESWELHDTGKGRFYHQQDIHTMPSGTEGISDDDLFIWVIPDDEEDEDLGYLHNQWVFIRG